jgi:hypothetical protein
MKIYRGPQLVVFLALLLGITMVSTALAGDSRSLVDLAFMVGHWVGASGQVDTEEIWTTAKGGVMLGLHRDVAPGKAAFFEFLRIEERDDAIIYVASPRGGGTTEFTLVKIDEGEAVFENLEHDFPQRISYRRDGERLTARIEGEVGDELRFSEWTWTSAD